MSEQKEMKNMKNAAEAQTAGQNTTETIVKQTETADAAKQNDAAEQQTDAAAFQVVNEGFSKPLKRQNAAYTARFRSARKDAR